MKRSSWTALILVFALFAIVSRPLPSQEISADDESEVADHMHDYLTRITTIKSSVIMGNRDGVRELATWLVEHETVSGLPEDFEPYVEMIRSYAREVVAAPDLKSAAMEFGFDTKPPEWADTISLMQRHQWAAERLWEGLIGPSDVAWSRGTDMLVDVPLRPAYVLDDTINGVRSDVIDKAAHRVHLLGGQGTITSTPDARAELYGELLGLCADCHISLGRGRER